MTDSPAGADEDMASPRIAIGVDVGGSGIKAAVVDVESGRFRSERLRVATPQPATPEAVSASIGRLDQAARQGHRHRRIGPGRHRPAGRGHGRAAADGRQHRPGMGRLPGRRAAGQDARAPGQHRQRRRRRGHRRDALRAGRRPARRRHLPDPRDRRRVGRVRRRRPRARTPSSARWRSAAGRRNDARPRRPGSGAACRGRPGRSTSTSTSSASRT